MEFKIDKEIFDNNPDLKIGAILIKNFNNARRSSVVESLLRGMCAKRKKEFANQDIHEHHTIRCWDTAYGKFGINPKKYQCSIGSLLEHVVNKGEIRHINLLVDLYNYYSLKFLLPVGGEDIDWLCGDLHLTYTTGKEAFRPLGSVDVKEVSEGEIAYKDDGGVTCRYWNHRECERTKFTPRTTNALILIEDLSRMHMDEFGRILKEIKEGIQKYIGGDLELFILTEDRPRIDLGAEGRKNVNDKKITKQEKLHYENEVKQ